MGDDMAAGAAKVRRRKPNRRTSYWRGRIMGGYTAKNGEHVTIAIHDDGSYMLHGAHGRLAHVTPVRDGALAGVVSWREVTYFLGTNAGFATETLASPTLANEAAKEYVELAERKPIEMWYPVKDSFYQRAEPDADGNERGFISLERLAEWREGFAKEHADYFGE